MAFDFEKVLIEALSKIEQKYFHVTTIEKDIVRERVFCYEFYHQMRLLLPDNGFDFNGEIDKRGHRYFDEVDRKNPDFIYHVQGEFNHESIIIEVKGKIDKNGIKKDFETLTTFINGYHYKTGYFILFNHTFEELKAEVILEGSFSKNIIILCKKDSDSKVERHHISELINGV